MVTKNRIDKNSCYLTDEQELIQLLLNACEINGAYNADPNLVDEFNQKNEEYFGIDCELKNPSDKSAEQYHQEKSNTWFMPDKYKHIDVLEYLLTKVNEQQQIDRIKYEYALYKERELDDVLRLMIYLVDIFRENDVLWGVGRGSSVSSYILFVIGINRIDPIKYDLDVKEFLK